MNRFSFLYNFFLIIFICSAVPAYAQKMKAEDVIARHLDSIANAETRATVKTRIAVGDAAAKFISSKDQIVQGRVVLASEGNRNFFGMNMNSTRYPGERFTFDGKNANAAMVLQNSRSVLGNLVQSNKMMLEEGLFGGTLSTSWLLLNMDANKGKLSFDGTKKIEGKEVYALGYSRKGGGDLDVTLYFDKENFRHVRTEYKRISSAGIGVRPEDSTRFNESRLKVVEDFSDFKAENGSTLPHAYRLFYSLTGQNGTTEIEWTFNLTEFAVNQKLGPDTFNAVP